MSVLADPHAQLSPAEKEDFPCVEVPFREAVGSLIFLAMVSCPDIAFAVNAISRHLNCYNNNHWQAVKKFSDICWRQLT